MSDHSTEKKFTCDWIFNILVVLCDGKVVCGCADPYGERPLGHLNKQNIHDIWNSDKIKQIRRDLNNGFSQFCLPCGLKRYLKEDETIPQQTVDLEVLPRIFFEPTVLCNLSCFDAVCSQESGIVKTRIRSSFPFDEFKKLMDGVGEKLIRLDFFNYGDPFVHPQAVEMVEFVKKKYPHIFLYSSTNGLMLDKTKIKRLVMSGIDEITFSVDGPDHETYIRYRQGGDFSKILNIMSAFVEERNALSREVPFINWRYIIFNWNHSRKKMNQTRKLAKRIGVDRLTWEITDHPEKAKSEIYQIGTRAWKRIYNEIWDSSQIGNAIKSKRFLARIKVPAKRLVMIPNRSLSIPVKVCNIGGAFWRLETFSGRRYVRLGAQLFNMNKQLMDLNYARAFPNRALAKNEKDVITIKLPALTTSGQYWVKFDMVSEGMDWFENGGSKVIWRKLSVT
jgi:hypothetical protein